MDKDGQLIEEFNYKMGREVWVSKSLVPWMEK